MQHTKEHLCELGCGRPAPDTTICMDCADHPRQAVNQFGAEDLMRLEAIARGEEQSKDITARNSTPPPGPKPPINITAFQLARDIAKTFPADVEELSSKPKKDAIDLYWKIIGDCEKAQAMLHGHQVHYSRSQYDEAYKELSNPMTYDELVDWFWERLGMRINPARLRKWKQRGKLSPVDDTIPPKFRPRHVLEVVH